MSMFQHIARVATMGAIAVLAAAASLAAAEEGGRYWVPSTTNPATNSVPSTTSPATHQPSLATRSTKRFATTHTRKRSPLAAVARSAPDPKAHRLILQVNTNDPAAMNLTLNNATNVTQHYKEIGEKVKIFVAGLAVPGAGRRRGRGFGRGPTGRRSWRACGPAGQVRPAAGRWRSERPLPLSRPDVRPLFRPVLGRLPAFGHGWLSPFGPGAAAAAGPSGSSALCATATTVVSAGRSMSRTPMV